MSAVPTLRFPEFDGEWVRSRIDEIGTLKSGVGFPEKEQGGVEGTPFYKVSDMNIPENSQDMVLANNYVTEEQIKRLKYKPIAQNSIIFAKVGAAIFLDRKRKARNFLLDNNMMAFLPSSEIDFRFIYQVFLQLNLAKFAQVGALPSYNASDIGIIKVQIPSLPEQQKIASFLTSVDKKIDLLRQKKDALELYKKGLMQKIFSQEIRFKQDDGSDFPDWEEVALGDVASVTKGKQLNRDTLTLGAAYPVINGGMTPSGYHDEFNTKENSITISEGGNSCGYVDFQRQKFWCGGHCYVLEPTGEVIDKKFAFQSLKYRQDDIMRLRVGSGLPNIQKGDLLKLAMVIPPELDEQRKIASFLSAIDAKIQNTSSQIEQMETFKKGLLQQMFV